MNEQRYLLDASALITPFASSRVSSLAIVLRQYFSEGKAGYQDVGDYQKDLPRKLEDWFSQGITLGRFLICKEVRDEVLKGRGRPGETLLKSLEDRYTLLKPKKSTFVQLKDVARFVEENYQTQYRDIFLKGADPILVALAKDFGLTIVTEEKHSLSQGSEPVTSGKPCIIEKPRLPYVAFAFGVRCISLMTAMIEVGFPVQH